MRRRERSEEWSTVVCRQSSSEPRMVQQEAVASDSASSLPVLAGGKIENSIFAAKTSQLTGAAGRRICQVFETFEIFSLLVLGQAGVVLVEL